METTRPAVEAVYRAHAATVARWVAHMAGPGFDVDDLVQDVFIVVHRRLGEFIGDEIQLKRWLYAIAARIVLEHRRRARVRRWLRGSADEVAGHLASGEPGPHQSLERRQTVAALYQVLDRLDEKYRTVLILFELEGLSGEEIGALTGRKVSTVWVLLHRARALFLKQAEKLSRRGVP